MSGMAEPNSGPGQGPRLRAVPDMLVVVLTYAMLGGPSTYFEWLVRATARAENAIFHKGNGIGTPSSEFPGLRMRAKGAAPLWTPASGFFTRAAVHTFPLLPCDTLRLKTRLAPFGRSLHKWAIVSVQAESCARPCGGGPWAWSGHQLQASEPLSLSSRCTRR